MRLRRVRGYAVHSLYLDSDGLECYWATVRQEKNRFKLRIRFYEEGPLAPAYVEIKQHAHGRTLKQRCPVPQRQLPAVLVGRSAETADEENNPPRRSALDGFIDKVRLLKAEPKVHVAYRREAYCSPDGNSIRLTLDREVLAERAAGVPVSTTLQHPRSVCEDAVVLEFKVAGLEPAWFRELVQALGLRRTSFAKYVAAVARHGLHTRSSEQKTTEHERRAGVLASNA